MNVITLSLMSGVSSSAITASLGVSVPDTTVAVSDALMVAADTLPEDMTAFPMAVHLEDFPGLFDAAFWSATNAGLDIRAFQDSVEIPTDLVYCDTLAETGLIFVKIDIAAASDTVFTFSWDGVSARPAVDAVNGQEAVWADYECVVIPRSSNADRTGKSIKGTDLGGGPTALQAPTGLTPRRSGGGEATFGGTNNLVHNTRTVSSMAGVFTLSTSFRATTASQMATVAYNQGGTVNRLGLVIDNGNEPSVWDNVNSWLSAGQLITSAEDRWHRLTVSYNAGVSRRATLDSHSTAVDVTTTTRAGESYDRLVAASGQATVLNEALTGAVGWYYLREGDTSYGRAKAEHYMLDNPFLIPANLLPSAFGTNINFATGDGTGWTVGANITFATSVSRSTPVSVKYPDSYLVVPGITPATDIYQDIDASSHSVDIDAGNAYVRLIAAGVGDFNDTDTLQWTISFLDVSAAEISNVSSGLVNPVGTANWDERVLVAKIPSGTRTVKVKIDFALDGGSEISTIANLRSLQIYLPASDTAGILFDTHADAIIPVASAWGLRKLVSTYTGPLIRIRDDIGEQDAGQDASGWLSLPATTGTIYVVRIYNQAPGVTGDDLVQTVTTKQPILQPTGMPSGKPAMKFDGVDDFLVGETVGTTRSYMVAKPQMYFLGQGGTPRESYAAMVQVPHADGANSTPFYRYGIGTDSGTGDTYEAGIRYNGNTTTVVQKFNRSGSGVIAALLGQGRFYELPTRSVFNSISGVDNTYPFGTAMRVGSNGLGVENWGGYLSELVVFSGTLADTTAFNRLNSMLLFASVAPGWGENGLFLINNKAGYTTNEWGIGELDLRSVALGPDITAGGFAGATHNFSETERGQGAIDGTTTSIWSAGTTSSLPVLAIQPATRELPIEGTFTIRDDAFFEQSTKTFNVAKVTQDGYIDSSDIVLASPAVQGAALEFTIIWP